MSKLPKIYTANIPKGTGNNHNLYYSFYENNVLEPSPDLTISLSSLKEIPNLTNVLVTLRTKDKTFDTYIVLINNIYLVTIDNEKIFLNDIVNIKRKDHF